MSFRPRSCLAIPHFAIACLALTVGGLMISASAHAQAAVRPQGSPRVASVDSISRLNREGHWQTAFTLAASSYGLVPTSTCPFYAEMVYSLDRLGRYDAAKSWLRNFDVGCSSNDIGDDRKTQLANARRDVALPALPLTGIDATGIRQFWQIVDTLSIDAEPSDSLWHSMFATPGYRLSWQGAQPLREDLEIAYRPSRRALRDSLSNTADDQATRLRHFARVLADRKLLDTYLGSLSHTLSLNDAFAIAQRFLPPGTTDGRQPPLVALALFRNDAYAVGTQGIVVDLENARCSNLPLLVAHEMHHVLIGYAATVRPTRTDLSSPDPLLGALFELRNEGAADQIDKPYPLVPHDSSMQGYADRYNREYASTRATLHIADSLLAGVPVNDPEALLATSQRVRSLFVFGGHPNGAYMMRTIVETFGVDSMFSADRNPFAFLRIYEAAEIKRGNGPTFSPATTALLDAEEKKLKRN